MIFTVIYIVTLSLITLVAASSAERQGDTVEPIWVKSPAICMAQPSTSDDMDTATPELTGQLECPPSHVTSSSLIVRFYRDGDKDTLDRSLAEMLRYDDYDMERCHDHMQWMFPLHEISMYASQYEILTGMARSACVSYTEDHRQLVPCLLDSWAAQPGLAGPALASKS